MDKIKIFVCLDHYLPGNKSGGPVVSIVNMVETISDQFQFYILTRDRDLDRNHALRWCTNQ